ncbi:hypothetical protein BJY04DRAFT_218903 [Aspergillus karnatakaensis]|uniref:uncharacterized protein n=1 Tax=Aspergillus karnatakaensis TaxID=1810916 RepID=UPI003CCE450E
MTATEAQESFTQTLKAIAPAPCGKPGKFTIDRNQWDNYSRDQLGPLFNALYEQQSSYVRAIQNLQHKHTDYKRDIRILEDNLDHARRRPPHGKYVDELEDKLSIKVKSERYHKKQIEELEAKVWGLQRKEEAQKAHVSELESTIAKHTLEEQKYTARIVELEAQLAMHEQHQKNSRLRIVDLGKKLEDRDQLQKILEDQNAGLMKMLEAVETMSAGGALRVQDTPHVSPSFTSLPDPPKLVDGTDPKFANWRYLMELTFTANPGQFKTPSNRIAYLASRTSGQAQDHLVRRLRSRILKPITDVRDAFEYLDTVYYEPELRTTDPAAFGRPDDSGENFWSHFRAFVWNAVKFEIPEEEWNQKLHEYLQLVLMTDLGEYSNYTDGTPKELAKSILLYMLRQQWDDVTISLTVGGSQTAGDI